EDGTAIIASDDGRGRLPNPDAVVRVRAADGEIVYERGEWPPLDRQIRARLRDSGVEKRNLAAPWLLRHASWIAGESVLANGEQVELALPLRNLASLNAKIRRGVTVGAVIAAAVVLLIGLGTTMRAFAPLRRATAMLAEVGTGSLGVRLPSR